MPQDYSWVTDEMFVKKLTEILDREEHLFSIPGVYDVVSKDSASYNEAMDRAESLDLDFGTALEEVAQSYSARQLLAIPGLYEEVSEYFNNDILKELKYEHDHDEEYEEDEYEDDPNWRETESGSTHLKPGHPDWKPPFRHRQEGKFAVTKENKMMMLRKHGISSPELGPDYFIPVDDEELDSEVMSWLHYGQDDPIYALTSRLIAYGGGETKASPEELDTLETTLEKMLMRADSEGVPEGEEADFDRMADLLEAVRSILSQYAQKIEAHQEDYEYNNELEQKERGEEQESRSRFSRTKTAALKPVDKKVVDAFMDKQPMDGRILTTDGQVLQTSGYMGSGATIAYWIDDYYVSILEEYTSKTEQSTANYLRKVVPKNRQKKTHDLRSTQNMRMGRTSIRTARFMEPVVEHGKWAVIKDKYDETYIVPGEYADDPAVIGDGVLDEVVEGWGAQMSAPGYMDQTEWEVFDTEQEAWDYLKEMYMSPEEYPEYFEENNIVKESSSMRYSSRTKTAVSDDQIFNYDEWEREYPILIIFKGGKGWEVVDGAETMEEAEELLGEYQMAFGPGSQVRIHDESYHTHRNREDRGRGFGRPPGIYGSTAAKRLAGGEITRSKSHTREELLAALQAGEQVWQLDTENVGEDDMLIGTYDEVLQNVLYHHDLADLPARWSLDLVDWLDTDDLARRPPGIYGSSTRRSGARYQPRRRGSRRQAMKNNDVVRIEICEDLNVGGYFARATQMDGQERDIPLYCDDPTDDDALEAVTLYALCGYPVANCPVTRSSFIRRSSFIQYRKAQMGADIALLQKSMQGLSKTNDKEEAINLLRDISDAALGIIEELGEEAKTASTSSQRRKRRRQGGTSSSLQADYLTLKNGINALQKATEKEDLILALQDVADSARDLLGAIG